jgi:hypothetical protein
MSHDLTVQLVGTGRFEDVLYLAPEPDEPFLALVNTLAQHYPQYPPYGGAFGRVIPHVTVARGERSLLDLAAAAIASSLPVTAVAEEAVLFAEVNSQEFAWEARARFPFRG